MEFYNVIKALYIFTRVDEVYGKLKVLASYSVKQNVLQTRNYEQKLSVRRLKRRFKCL